LLVKALRRAGFKPVRQTGSHLHLKHPERPGVVTVPMHRGDLRWGTLKSILKQAGLTEQQLRDLL
jgi:predicted RNA binding protein YcfA (HicA-like mRNA interferase family)